MSTATAHATAVILLDREPSDPATFVTADQADSNNVPVSDRDGNQYVGRMVFHDCLYTPASRYVAESYRTGQTRDGQPVGPHQLLLVDLAKLPRTPAPLKFVR